MVEMDTLNSLLGMGRYRLKAEYQMILYYKYVLIHFHLILALHSLILAKNEK